MTKEKTIKIFKSEAKRCERDLYNLLLDPSNDPTLPCRVEGGEALLEWMEKVHASQISKADELKEILQTIKKLEDDYLIITYRKMDASEI
jgi:hypothetical protein